MVIASLAEVIAWYRGGGGGAWLVPIKKFM